MGFKMSIINNDCNRYEETIIVNNDMGSKRKSQSFNPDLTILKAEWGYK